MKMGVLILKYPCSAKKFALRLAYNCSPYFCRTPPF